MSTSEKLQWVILDTSRRGGLKAAGRSFAAARGGERRVQGKVKKDACICECERRRPCGRAGR